MKKQIEAEEYKLIVEKSPIMIWRSTVTMECDYFNEVWLNFTGRSLEQEIGNGWTEGVHPEDFDRCLQIYKSHFLERKIFEMEYRLRRFDGEYRWIFDRGVPYFELSGKFKGYIGSCIDVTERVISQNLLKIAQENEINQLRGILPICSYCKKIRNDENYWEQLESYISNHSQALFSHGICPACTLKIIKDMKTSS